MIVLSLANVFTGFTLTPILPLCYELVCEIVFPIKEAIPSGLLLSMGQIVGIVLTIGINPLIVSGTYQDAYAICYIFAGIIGISFVLMLFFFGKYKRLDYEARKKQLTLT